MEGGSDSDDSQGRGQIGGMDGMDGRGHLRMELRP